MPAEDEKTTVEVSDDNQEEAPKKGSNKLILFGAIGVGALVIGVVLALFVLKPMMADSGEEAAEDETEQVEEVKKDSHGKPAAKPKKKKGAHGESQSLVVAVGDIVVNPAGTGGTRFLSVSFGFELGSAELAAEFEARQPLVRDALITILSSKTVAQLTDFKQKEIVRYQVKKRLSQLLDTDEISAVYYTDFVLQ